MKLKLPAESDFPADGRPVEQLDFLINWGVLAPSSHNSQPWLFIRHDNHVAIHADRTRALPVVDPHDRELSISCGCALMYMRVAAAHFNVPVKVYRNPEDGSDLLANLYFDEDAPPQQALSELFEYLPRRVTNRFPYVEGSVSDEQMAALAEVCATHRVTLRAYHDDTSRHALADRIAEADVQQMASKTYRRELASWLHHNRSRSRDGMPGFTQGMNEFASLAAPIAIRTFDVGEGQAARDRELAEHSPALCIIGTNKDHHTDWVRTGEALAQLLLVATREGLSASFLNQPIEIDRLRADLAKHVGVRFPQILLRLGKPTREARHTPRRPASEVTVDAGEHEEYQVFQGF
ncbi:MAG: nitroreductase [Planctomycetes bacterium]|nr:nitroreductase [Planctomycetota bacterium]